MLGKLGILLVEFIQDHHIVFVVADVVDEFVVEFEAVEVFVFVHDTKTDRAGGLKFTRKKLFEAFAVDVADEEEVDGGLFLLNKNSGKNDEVEFTEGLDFLCNTTVIGAGFKDDALEFIVDNKILVHYVVFFAIFGLGF